VALAALGILLGLPLFALIALLIHLDSPGPVFYRQTRVGKGGTPFCLFKFRTMAAGAPEQLEAALERDPALRLSYLQFQKLWDDPRLTRLGRFLRRTSLDELPQLWNVVWGEMSLVGPRPILPDQAGLYGPSLPLYISVRPGLTGLWQVSGRNRLSFAERARLDERYIRNWSLLWDLRLLARTVGVVLRGDGAC
jgi:lipopolysaccharide/colanic/teichoic acid biosynthesis glycosyltransferase